MEHEELRVAFEGETPRLRFRGEVTDGGMKLFLSVWAKVAEKFETYELAALLREHVAFDLVQLEILDDIVRTLTPDTPVERRRIARGIPPQPGREGRILFLVRRLARGQSPLLGAEGFCWQIDLPGPGIAGAGQRYLIEDVNAGQVVVRIFPGMPGVAGQTVLGETLTPAPIAALQVHHDDTLLVREERPSEDGAPLRHLVARIPGALLDDAGTLRIVQRVEIPHSLGKGSGNLLFDGKILVRGDITDGVRIEASQGIEVAGKMVDSVLRAPEGDVRVRDSVTGGSIETGGSVSVQELTDSEISAKGNLTVERFIHKGRVQIGGALHGPQAAVAGGHLRLGRGAAIRTLGNPEELPTRLVFAEARDQPPKVLELARLISAHEEAIRLILLHLGPAADEDADRFSSTDHRTKVAALKAKLQKLRQSLTALRAEDRTIRESQGPVQSDETVRVNQAIFPGVVVHSGEYKKSFLTVADGPVELRRTEAGISVACVVPE